MKTLVPLGKVTTVANQLEPRILQLDMRSFP